MSAPFLLALLAGLAFFVIAERLRLTACVACNCPVRRLSNLLFAAAGVLWIAAAIRIAIA